MRGILNTLKEGKFAKTDFVILAKQMQEFSFSVKGVLVGVSEGKLCFGFHKSAVEWLFINLKNRINGFLVEHELAREGVLPHVQETVSKTRAYHVDELNEFLDEILVCRKKVFDYRMVDMLFFRKHLTLE